MWGELWDYPFNPAVWGTVAAWVGSQLTGVGVLAAAIYYIYDKRVGDKAQARHVTFVHKHWTSDHYYAVVHNFSDESIFDVTPHQGRKFFRDVVADQYRKYGQPPTDVQIYMLRDTWAYTSGGIVQVQSAESGHVRPGDSKDITFEGPRSPTQVYWVEFRDSMARTWTLELDSREPHRGSSQVERVYTWKDFPLHRKEYLAYRKKEKNINRWLDKNLKRSKEMHLAGQPRSR